MLALSIYISKYDDTVVKWGYIIDFCNIDKAMSIRMAPRLIDRLIMFPPFTAMRANLAANNFTIL